MPRDKGKEKLTSPPLTSSEMLQLIQQDKVDLFLSSWQRYSRDLAGEKAHIQLKAFGQYARAFNYYQVVTCIYVLSAGQLWLSLLGKMYLEKYRDLLYQAFAKYPCYLPLLKHIPAAADVSHEVYLDILDTPSNHSNVQNLLDWALTEKPLPSDLKILFSKWFDSYDENKLRTSFCNVLKGGNNIALLNGYFRAMITDDYCYDRLQRTSHLLALHPKANEIMMMRGDDLEKLFSKKYFINDVQDVCIFILLGLSGDAYFKSHSSKLLKTGWQPFSIFYQWMDANQSEFQRQAKHFMQHPYFNYLVVNALINQREDQLQFLIHFRKQSQWIQSVAHRFEKIGWTDLATSIENFIANQTQSATASRANFASLPELAYKHILGMLEDHQHRRALMLATKKAYLAGKDIQHINITIENLDALLKELFSKYTDLTAQLRRHHPSAFILNLFMWLICVFSFTGGTLSRLCLSNYHCEKNAEETIITFPNYCLQRENRFPDPMASCDQGYWYSHNVSNTYATLFFVMLGTGAILIPLLLLHTPFLLLPNLMRNEWFHRERIISDHLRASDREATTQIIDRMSAIIDLIEKLFERIHTRHVPIELQWLIKLRLDLDVIKSFYVNGLQNRDVAFDFICDLADRKDTLNERIHGINNKIKTLTCVEWAKTCNETNSAISKVGLLETNSLFSSHKHRRRAYQLLPASAEAAATSTSTPSIQHA